MLLELAKDPGNFQFWLEDTPSRIACTLAWDNPCFSVRNTKNAEELLFQISPSGAFTNLLPVLWRLPLWLNPWRRAEKMRHDALHKWWNGRLESVKSRTEKGVQRPCWASRYLSEKQSSLSGHEEAASCIGMTSLVSVLTIGGPLQYFTIAMVHHPAWLRRCQKEIDEECQGRKPTLADWPKLPVLRACIKETMRWRPNVPTGRQAEYQWIRLFC